MDIPLGNANVPWRNRPHCDWVASERKRKTKKKRNGISKWIHSCKNYSSELLHALRKDDTFEFLLQNLIIARIRFVRNSIGQIDTQSALANATCLFVVNFSGTWSHIKKFLSKTIVLHKTLRLCGFAGTTYIRRITGASKITKHCVCTMGKSVWISLTTKYQVVQWSTLPICGCRFRQLGQPKIPRRDFYSALKWKQKMHYCWVRCRHRVKKQTPSKICWWWMLHIQMSVFLCEFELTLLLIDILKGNCIYFPHFKAKVKLINNEMRIWIVAIKLLHHTKIKCNGNDCVEIWWGFGCIESLIINCSHLWSLLLTFHYIVLSSLHRSIENVYDKLMEASRKFRMTLARMPDILFCSAKSDIISTLLLCMCEDETVSILSPSQAIYICLDIFFFFLSVLAPSLAWEWDIGLAGKRQWMHRLQTKMISPKFRLLSSRFAKNMMHVNF